MRPIFPRHAPRRSWIRVAVFVLISLAAFGYGVAVVGLAWNAPNKGFIAFTGRRIVYVDRTSEAFTAGLREGDVVRAVDGIPTSSTLEYVDRVLHRHPGERTTLTVERSGSRHDVSIDMRRSPVPVGPLIASLMAAVLLGLGIIAVIGRPGDIASERFWRSTVTYATVYTGILSYTNLLVHPWLGAVALVAVFVAPPVAMDLALAFPSRSKHAFSGWRLAGYLSSFLLLAAAIVTFGQAYADFRSGIAGDTWLFRSKYVVTANLTLTVLLIVIGLRIQIRNLRETRGRERGQLMWLTYGYVAAGVPALLAIPSAIADLDRFLASGYQPYAGAMAILYFAAGTLAVLRVRLADVDAVIHRSVAYAVASGAAVGIYLALAIGVGLIVEWVSGEAKLTSHLLGVAAAAMLFWPIRSRVTGWLDRRFHRDRLHYVDAMRELAQTITKLREPDDLAREVVERTVDALRASSGALYLREHRMDTELQRAYATNPEYPVARAAEGSKDSGEDSAEVSIVGRDGLVGLLVLGPRLGGDLYSSKDRALLSALAGQLATALENSRAFGTIAEMTRTLEHQNREIRDLRDHLEDENRYLRGRLEASLGDDSQIVGSSREIREIRKQIERAAGSEAIVLIRGETGTGKGLLARAIHEASGRVSKPFIHVDFGAIPQGVFESELFGHERGAFTGAIRSRRGMFELADTGTLFLDEIGELPLEMQPKILRAVQERSFMRVGGNRPVRVDVRLVAATNRDLKDMVRRGQFREDLYYRLGVIEIRVPPLRARSSDLQELVQSLLPRLCRRNHKPLRHLTEGALHRLQTYAWPGNIRELENILERAIVLSDRAEILAADLTLPESGTVTSPSVSLLGAMPGTDHRELMESIEKERLVSALRAARGNRSTAARSLGIPRTTLINKLRRYQLEN